MGNGSVRYFHGNHRNTLTHTAYICRRRGFLCRIVFYRMLKGGCTVAGISDSDIAPTLIPHFRCDVYHSYVRRCQPCFFSLLLRCCQNRPKWFLLFVQHKNTSFFFRSFFLSCLYGGYKHLLRIYSIFCVFSAVCIRYDVVA